MTKTFVFIPVCLFLMACGKNENTRFERLDATTTGINFNNEVLEKDTFNIMHNKHMYNGGGMASLQCGCTNNIK